MFVYQTEYLSLLYTIFFCFQFHDLRTREGEWVRDQFSRTPLMTVNSLGLFISDFKMPDVEYLQTGLKLITHF